MARWPALPLPLLLLAVALCDAAEVTPVEKVISLLERLGKKVEEEGKAEAAAYDKYACFCKEQADNKQYAIEKSTKKIAKLSSAIELLGTEITGLDNEVLQLGEKVDGIASDMKAAKATRDAEHKSFLVAQADVNGAVQACEGALEALAQSKKSMRGKVELEAAALAQVRAVASLALRRAAGASELARLGDLLAEGKPGQAYQYSHHSNDIIATIETLKQKFSEQKAALENEESEAQAAFEKRQLNLANEREFAGRDRDEREAVAEEKREAKAAAEGEQGAEVADRQADQDFLAEVTGDCEAKARLWDQRSQTRAQELQAIAEATTALKDGVAPNWKANKKLVGVQQRAVVVRRMQDGELAAPAAPAFVQVQRHAAREMQEEEQHEAVRRAQALLSASGERLASPALLAASMKVSASEDHFVKVRQIIKDLVEKLQEQAMSEKTQKAFCNEAMGKAVSQRDASQSESEKLAAEIESKASQKAALKDEIAELSKQIAANNKALVEATELRTEESAENQKTVTEAEEGKAAVESALKVLKGFYEGQALLQTRFVPAKADREGKTVGDLAPEVFDSEYSGSQEASKGILGLLDVVLSDFARTVETVTEEERTAAEAFTAFKTKSEADSKAKSALRKTKEGEVSDIESDLVDLADGRKEAEAQHQSAVDELQKLQAMCVDGEESYEERVAKRKQEIEALKEAHNLLESWQQG